MQSDKPCRKQHWEWWIVILLYALSKKTVVEFRRRKSVCHDFFLHVKVWNCFLFKRSHGWHVFSGKLLSLHGELYFPVFYRNNELLPYLRFTSLYKYNRGRKAIETHSRSRQEKSNKLQTTASKESESCCKLIGFCHSVSTWTLFPLKFELLFTELEYLGPCKMLRYGIVTYNRSF